MRLERRYADRGWSTLDRYGRRLLVPRWKAAANETEYASIDDFVRLGDKARFDPSFAKALARGEKEGAVDWLRHCLSLSDRNT